MNLTYFDYAKMENLFYDYYDNMKMIKTKKEQVKKLQERLQKIESDYSCASNYFILNAETKAISYDKINVMGGSLPCSSMDRQVDIIFSKIEEEKESLTKQILLMNILIRKLESQNDSTEQLLELLDEESRQLIRLKFQNRLSYKQIAYKTNMSEGNISKKLKKVKRNFLKWMEYQQDSHGDQKDVLQ